MQAFLEQFSLTASQLQPLLVAIGLGHVTKFTIEPIVSFSEQSADKCVATLRYENPDNATQELRLFAKKCIWKQRWESTDYYHLQSAGIPTPRLYAAILNAQGEEIIFLEALTAIAFDDQSDTEWRKFLSVVARFNACPVSSAYASHLYDYEQGAQLVDGLWYTGLNPEINRDQLTAELTTCGIPLFEIPPLVDAAASIFQQVEAHPHGLLHQDFHHQNVGWRGNRAELVVFDVHKNAFGPRFADIASYLGTPDWSRYSSSLDASLDGTATRREQFIEHYLTEYAHFGGESVSLETFHTETSALLWAHKINSLDLLRERRLLPRIEEVVRYLAEKASPDLAVADRSDHFRFTDTPK